MGSIDIAHQHEAWRYTLMSGLIPAIPLIVIRPFLPESPVGPRNAQLARSEQPRISELFSPALRRTTIVTTLMFACSYGAAFGAIQQIPQIVPGLPDVKAKTEGLKKPQQGTIQQATAADITKVQELGGLVGRFLLAVLAVRIASRRTLIRIFQIPRFARDADCLRGSRRAEFADACTTASFSPGCLPSDSSASGATTCRASIL